MQPVESRLRGLARQHGRWLAAGAGVGLAFCAIWWLLLANALVPTDHVEELVIPRGTADAIVRGEPFAFVPATFSMPPGSRLRVVNEDAVEHRIADSAIPAGASADIEATESGELVCTIHPDGHLAIALEKRPPLAAMAGLTLALSLTTAAAAWAVRTEAVRPG